jgi:hypothetical protein
LIALFFLGLGSHKLMTPAARISFRARNNPFAAAPVENGLMGIMDTNTI